MQTKNTIQHPRYNISEDDEKLTLEIALPGVDKDSIKLSSEGFTLDLEAERIQQVPEEWNLISSAEPPKKYALNLKIDAEYDLSQTEASFENQVLRLRVPSRGKGERILKIQ